MIFLEDSMEKCGWCLGNSLYERYHDEEWGVPVYDDRKHYEFLVLESAQAGLSWLTILKKREAYREAYAGFDPVIVSGWGVAEVEHLMANAGIVRNRKKIEASITNAAVFLAIQKEYGSFSAYIWGFVDRKPVQNQWETLKQVPAETKAAVLLAKDLKKRGCKFLGPKIMYAHMQATGLVNDHLLSCSRHAEVRG